MNWQNIAIIGAVGIGAIILWPQIQNIFAKKGALDIPAPQNVPELSQTPIQFRHTTVSGPSAPSTSSGFRRARVQGRSAPSVPSAPSGFRRSSVRGAATGGNCRFTSGSTVCWNNVCTTFNPKSSDASSVSGRQTLCARVRAKYLAQNRGSQGLSYVGMNIGVA